MIRENGTRRDYPHRTRPTIRTILDTQERCGQLRCDFASGTRFNKFGDNFGFYLFPQVSIQR